MSFPPGVTLRVLVRSLFIQGSWNYETLIGTGFAFTMIPVLRHLHGADSEAFRDAVGRHTEVFNSHPYLATVAVGAVARLEADRAEPALIARFKSALRGSLGSLGDQLVWGAWRPAAMLLGIALMLAGTVWWLGVAVFLLVYNALNLGLRAWGWRIGTRAGREVGKALREVPLQSLARRAADVGAIAAGFALALAVAPARTAPVELGLALTAAAAGVWLGVRSRPVFFGLLGVVWFLALAWRWSW